MLHCRRSLQPLPGASALGTLVRHPQMLHHPANRHVLYTDAQNLGHRPFVYRLGLYHQLPIPMWSILHLMLLLRL